MFKSVKNYNHILAKELSIFNENIDWLSVLEKSTGMSDEKILTNLILPKVWVKKSHEDDLTDRIRLYYFKHFTKLFKSLPDIKEVYVMMYKFVESSIPEELLNLYAQKESALMSFLKINNIGVLPNQTSSSYVFPLYHIFTNEKMEGKLIKDNDLWSITIKDSNINRILMIVKMMTLGIDVKTALSTSRNFYYI